MTADPIRHAMYAGLALVLGLLLVYDKFVNDVVAFEDLAEACADDVEKIVRESGWRSEMYRMTVPNLGDAVLHRNPLGYADAVRAIVEKRNYCFRFDPNGRTRSVYHFTVDGETVMDYASVADRRRMNVDGLFYVGILLIFGVAPFNAFQYLRKRRL